MSASCAALALTNVPFPQFLKATASTTSTLIPASTAALATAFAPLAHLMLTNYQNQTKPLSEKRERFLFYPIYNSKQKAMKGF